MRIAYKVKSIATSLLLLIALPLTAQTYRGGIGGTVVDIQGGEISNAKVALTNADTGAVRETNTTSAGGYVFQDLQIGKYFLTITANGFGKTILNDIAVNPGAVTSVNSKLLVSEVQQVVDVSIDTTSEIQNSVFCKQRRCRQQGGL